MLQLARHLFPMSPVFVFCRDPAARELAIRLGAAWAGESGELPPCPPDAIIDTTPAWKPVVEALACLAPGGRLVINAIRKEDADKAELLRIRYQDHLWMEKEIRTVANVTGADIREFLSVAAAIPIRPVVETFPLEDANLALVKLRNEPVRGAKVLVISPSGV